jgi:hypothetical protein
MGDGGMQLCCWKHGQSASCGKRPMIEKENPEQVLAAFLAAFPNMLPKSKQQAGLFAHTFRCTDEKVGSCKALSKLCKREAPITLQQGMVARFKSWMVCIYGSLFQMCALFSTDSQQHSAGQAHCWINSASPGKVEHALPCAFVRFLYVVYRRVVPRGRWRSQMQSRGTLPQHQPHHHRCC